MPVPAKLRKPPWKAILGWVAVFILIPALMLLPGLQLLQETLEIEMYPLTSEFNANDVDRVEVTYSLNHPFFSVMSGTVYSTFSWSKISRSIGGGKSIISIPRYRLGFGGYEISQLEIFTSNGSYVMDRIGQPDYASQSNATLNYSKTWYAGYADAIGAVGFRIVGGDLRFDNTILRQVIVDKEDNFTILPFFENERHFAFLKARIVLDEWVHSKKALPQDWQIIAQDKIELNQKFTFGEIASENVRITVLQCGNRQRCLVILPSKSKQVRFYDQNELQIIEYVNNNDSFNTKVVSFDSQGNITTFLGSWTSYYDLNLGYGTAPYGPTSDERILLGQDLKNLNRLMNTYLRKP